MRPYCNRIPRYRSGTTLVETAIVLNIVLVVVFAIMDYGKLVMTKQLLDNAARAGARQATTGATTLTTSNIQSTVLQALAGQNLSGQTITVYQVNPLTGANLSSNWNNTPLGGSIAVQISGNYLPLLPVFSRIPSPLAMQSTAMMTCEAN
jgi:Flp pilus assembly protein TadG